MIKDNDTFTFDSDFLDVQDTMIYASPAEFSTEAKPTIRMSYPDELEYVFELVRSSFLCFDTDSSILPPLEDKGKNLRTISLTVISLPFLNEENDAEIVQWNDLVSQLSKDFQDRRESALRSKCSLEQLSELIRNGVEEFDYPDRMRLDAEKLTNLVIFVYDYCMLTMNEARLHSGLDINIYGKVTIRDKEYSVPLRICAAIDKYQPTDSFNENGITCLLPNYILPTVRLCPTVKNPHANDSILSAMFADLMHKFFLSFGLKRHGKSEWAKAERMLIYELLRLFGLCKSTKPATESKYVTTVINEHGKYFSTCNLRSWIRENQAYSYLMCCTRDMLTQHQELNEPFLSLDCYEEVINNVSPSSQSKEEDRPLKMEDLPREIQSALKEVAGGTAQITHVEYGLVKYAIWRRSIPNDEQAACWDTRLDYVHKLILSAFEYVSFLPSNGEYLVIQHDLNDTDVKNRLKEYLEKDLLSRLDDIPRGKFTREKAMAIIHSFVQQRPKTEREIINEEKLYVLFLFVYDYTYKTYYESATSSYLRLYISSEINVCGKGRHSTMLADDMLSGYLQDPFCIIQLDETSYRQCLRRPDLRVPSIAPPVKLPSCNVKNMTAMFFDLFARFFKAFGLSKRPDVKYVSDHESILIGELASCCGICKVADKPLSARTMYMTNKDYFQKSLLQFAIRENEYGYLMLNTMSEELFTPKKASDNKDS